MSDDRGLYFNADELPSAVPSYVCWIDIMGIAPRMRRSTKTAANFIFKLHTAVVNGQSDDVSLFPVMDGVYVTSDQKAEILSFVESVFSDLAKEFINEPNPAYQFIPKGTLAYGPVVDGDDVSPEASHALSAAEEYKNAIILGIPVIQAFTSEGKAPPFGVYVHESARTFSPDEENPLPYVWWKWYRGADSLKDKLGCNGACSFWYVIFESDGDASHADDLLNLWMI